MNRAHCIGLLDAKRAPEEDRALGSFHRLLHVFAASELRESQGISLFVAVDLYVYRPYVIRNPTTCSVIVSSPSVMARLATNRQASVV